MFQILIAMIATALIPALSFFTVYSVIASKNVDKIHYSADYILYAGYFFSAIAIILILHFVRALSVFKKEENKIMKETKSYDKKQMLDFIEKQKDIDATNIPEGWSRFLFYIKEIVYKGKANTKSIAISIYKDIENN